MKKMILFIVLTIMISIPGLADSAKEDCYILGHYAVCPGERAVKERQRVGGVDWDGVAYVQSQRINYDNTSLIFLGKHVLFKEDLQADMDQLQPIYSSFQRGETEIYSDGNHIYVIKSGGIKKYAISHFQKLNDYVYQKEGRTYILDDEYGLVEIAGNSQPDYQTLTFVTDHFYKDKNGLYHYSAYNTTTPTIQTTLTRIEDNVSGNMQPVIRENYLIYNDSVYALGKGSLQKLDLNPATVGEFVLDRNTGYTILADGRNVYTKAHRDGTYQLEKNNSQLNVWKQVRDWIVLGDRELPYTIDKNNNLYIGNGQTDHKVERKQVEGHLIEKKDGYYLVKNFPQSTKINKLYIYNYDARAYELFRENEYGYVGNQLYSYKKRLYSHKGLPVHDAIESRTLRVLSSGKGELSHFLTDGKNLLFNGPVTGYSSRDGMIVFKEKNQLLDTIDSATLKVMNPYTLMDKDFIYAWDNGIQRIPKRALGIPAVYVQ